MPLPKRAIISPAHRGKKIAQKFAEVLEVHAKNLGYHGGCFVTESHDQHPRKPLDYKSLENFLENMGWKKTSIVIDFDWMTIQPDGTKKNQMHQLMYWLKNLSTDE